MVVPGGDGSRKDKDVCGHASSGSGKTGSPASASAKARESTVIMTAENIHDKNQIIGTGMTIDGTGYTFLATPVNPVPEPAIMFSSRIWPGGISGDEAVLGLLFFTSPATLRILHSL